MDWHTEIKGEEVTMTKESDRVAEWIRSYRIVAIVRGLRKEMCMKLSDALYNGGIRSMEITFDQTGSMEQGDTAESIAALRSIWGEKMKIGAGTVLSFEQLSMAREAGASYIVTPNTDPELIREAKYLGMAVLAGAMTPSEIQEAYMAGADLVKVFPAAVLGPDYIRAVMAPLGHIPILAVGGVNENNIREYIKAGALGAGVGGNLVNGKWIEEGKMEQITKLAQEYVKNASDI